MKTLVVQHQQTITNPFKVIFCFKINKEEVDCEDSDLVGQYLEVRCFNLKNSQP